MQASKVDLAWTATPLRILDAILAETQILIDGQFHKKVALVSMQSNVIGPPNALVAR